MSAAVKYLTKKAAEAEAELEAASREASIADKRTRECEERHFKARAELGSALDRDIEKAKGKLASEKPTKAGVPRV